MKKNIFSKIAAIVATTAMAVCAIVATPSVAKAADGLYLVGWIEGANVDGTSYELENGSIEVTFTEAAYVAISNGTTWYMTDGWLGSGLTEATLYDSNTLDEGNKLEVPAGSWEITVVKNSDGTYKISYEELVLADPSDVIAKIDAIGTVAYTDDCLNKIKAAEAAYEAYTGDKAGITNYATLTAARAKYDELKAAAMGEVTIYVKAADWTEVKGHVWGSSKLLGEWDNAPKLEKDTKNTDWYVCKVTITDSNNNFIFFTGSGGDGNQSGDLKVDAKGTYWVTLTADTLKTATLSTTAPTGWVGATPTPDTGDETDTADMAPVVAMVAVAALAAAVVLKKKTVVE